MADYISDFSMYKGSGKVLIGFIFVFFVAHMVIFFRSMSYKIFAHQITLEPSSTVKAPHTFERKLEKNIECEVIPSMLIIAVVIISRGTSIEGVILVIVMVLGYIILLVGEQLDKPDLKIVGRVGYGVSTIMMAWFAMFYYNNVNGVINNSP